MSPPRIPGRVIAHVERAADAMLARSLNTPDSRTAANAAKLAAHGYDAVRRHRRGAR